jgi:hypothetical protein
MSAWPHAVHAIGADGLHFHHPQRNRNHLAEGEDQAGGTPDEDHNNEDRH